MLRAFMKEIENDTKLFCIIEDDNNKISGTPPTKAKTPRSSSLFEMYVKMYERWIISEIDPTIFVALTYSFIFGAMFGDVDRDYFWLLVDFCYTG